MLKLINKMFLPKMCHFENKCNIYHTIHHIFLVVSFRISLENNNYCNLFVTHFNGGGINCWQIVMKIFSLNVMCLWCPNIVIDCVICSCMSSDPMNCCWKFSTLLLTVLQCQWPYWVVTLHLVNMTCFIIVTMH